MNSISSKLPRFRLNSIAYQTLRQHGTFCVETTGDVNRAAQCQICKSTTKSFAAIPATTPKEI